MAEGNQSGINCGRKKDSKGFCGEVLTGKGINYRMGKLKIFP